MLRASTRILIGKASKNSNQQSLVIVLRQNISFIERIINDLKIQNNTEVYSLNILCDQLQHASLASVLLEI